MKIKLPDKNVTVSVPDDANMDLVRVLIGQQFYGIEPDKSWSTDPMAYEAPSAESKTVQPQPGSMESFMQPDMPDTLVPSHADYQLKSSHEPPDAYRPDGSLKGPGFPGVQMKTDDGKDMTEFSIGVHFDGEERLIPTLVPSLSPAEMEHLRTGGKVTDAIVDKAVEHARQRIKENKSPFYEPVEAPPAGQQSQDILDKAKGIGPEQRDKTVLSYAPYMAVKAIKGAMGPLLGPLRAMGMDTRKVLDTAAEYWQKQLPEAKMPNIGIVKDEQGDWDIQRIDDMPIDEIVGATSELTGFMAPASAALKGGGLVAEKLSAYARPFYRNILKGMIGGALLGEGKKDETLEMMAMFGVFEGAGYALGKIPGAIKKIKDSNMYRNATIKERGLVVQNLEQTLKQNPNISEAELAKMSDDYFRQAMAKRSTGEAPAATPQGPAPVPPKPQGPAAQTPAAMEAASTPDIIKAIVANPKSDIPNIAMPVLQARGVTAQQVNDMIQQQMDEAGVKVDNNLEKVTNEFDKVDKPTPPTKVQAPPQKDTEQTPGEIFIKPILKSDKGGTSRSRILSGLQETAPEGHEAVYKPYGDQGKGYYYVPVKDAGTEQQTPGASDTSATTGGVSSNIKVTDDTVKVDIPESKAESLKPKEQKKYLMDEIEAAIAAAPEDAGVYYTGPQDKSKKITASSNQKTWHEFIRQAQKEGKTITIEVPGDGEYVLINSKETLKEFQKKAKGFPAAEMKNKKGGPSVPTIKPTGKRVTEFPGEYKMPYKPKKPPTMIEMPKEKTIAGFYEDGFYSNGAFLVKMPKPKTKRQLQKPSSPVSNFTNVDTSSLQKTTIGNEVYTDPAGEKDTGQLKVWVANMSQEFPYNPEFMDFIFSKHPKSELMMNKDGVLYYLNEKMDVVGVQMPLLQAKPQPAGTNATPSGMASMGEFANIPTAMELPEVVKLGKMLMDGKVPKVVQKIGRNLGIRGIFTPKGAGNIKVVADLFQDSMQAAKTIAHEIGHLVDYLDERTMARGNILGRIASLKKYLKKELESVKKRELTDADRARLMDEAQKLLKESEVWIDEVITKEMKVEPQDILNIWNSVEGGINIDLVDYIKGLSTAEKKAVVKEALKGRVPSEVKRFAGQVQVKTGKKIKQSSGSLHDIYTGLINRELEKRRAYKWEEVTTELKDFTMKWKPFDPSADPAYTKYRFKSTELYADALSALITNPAYLQKEAPIFYEAFFEFLSSKPVVQDTYAEILATAHKSSIGKARQHLDDILDMFAKGTEKRNKAIAENQKQPISVLEQAMTSLWDQSEGVLRLVRAFEKHFNQTGLDAANARFAVQELQHIASVTGVYLSDIQKAIIKPLEDAGHSLSDLGVMGFYKRISEGDRALKANPLGIDQTVAERDLSIIGRHIWGEEKFAEIEGLLQRFRKIRESELYPELRKSALFTDKLQSHIEQNQHHLKWDVSAYFEEVLNSGASGVGHIYKQVGTLAGIDNPVVATILQDLSLMRSALINQAKQEIIPILRHAGEIRKAPTKYSQDKKAMVPVPAPAGYDVLTVFERSEPGVPHHYLVKKNVAEIFEYQDIDSYQLYNAWTKMSRVIKELIVGKNIAWMARNLNRDMWGAIKNIPGMRVRDIPTFIKAAMDVFPEVAAEAYKKQTSVRIRDMKKRRGLATFRQWNATDDSFDNEIMRQLKSYKLIHSADAESKHVIAAVKKVWDFLDETGQLSEMWAKVATQKYLEDPEAMQRVMGTEIGRGDFGRIQARITRELAGTPDSKQRSAKHRILNSLFLFSEMRKAGMRQLITAYKSDKTGYAFKTFVINVLPKMMKHMILANGGVMGVALIANSMMGDDEREWAVKWIQETADAWDRIPDYDKMHYDCIPIDILENGKAVYLRFPKDYEGQIFGSMGHLAAKEIMHRIDNDGDLIEVSKGVRDVLKEQVPYDWTPLIKAHWNLLKWTQGESPQEWHGADRIPRSVQEQGLAGTDYIKESWPYIWRGYLKDMGLSNWANLHYGPKKDQEWYEKLLRQPGLSAIGSYLKFSDRGIEEKIYREWDKIKAEDAKEHLEARKASIRLAAGDYKTAEEIVKDLMVPGVTSEKIQKQMYQKIPDVYLRMLMKAQTEEQKIAVLSKIARQ